MTRYFASPYANSPAALIRDNEVTRQVVCVMQNPLTPLRFLERASSVHPDRTAIIDGVRTFTYAAMAAQVTRLARAFQARGLQPGDRIADLAPNCAEVLVAHFAVPLAGGVLVTINTRLSAEEIAAIVEHSGAVFLLADAPLVEPALANLAAVTTRYDDLLAAGSDEHLAYTVPDEDDAISVNYTSGTTGAPKGVVYTHRGAYLNSLGEVIHQGLVDGSSYLWTLPMFHCNGWCTTWALTAVAGTHVCLRATRADDIWRLIDRAGVSHTAGAPAATGTDRHHRGRPSQPVDHRGIRRSQRPRGARVRAHRNLRPLHGVRTTGHLGGPTGRRAVPADGPAGRGHDHRRRRES